MPTTIKNHIPNLNIQYKDVEIIVLLQDDNRYPFSGFYKINGEPYRVNGATFEAVLSDICTDIDYNVE